MKTYEKMFSLWNFEFHSPWFLCLFLLLIPLLIRDFMVRKNTAIPMPSIKGLREAQGYRIVKWLLKSTKYIILSALIIAMARPRTYTIIEDRDENKGVDIILTIDVSLSMLAKDLEPDRLTALKHIATDFVDVRRMDRIGMVAYSGEAITKVPITTDHQVIKDEIKTLSTFELEQGTAIGEGLVVAVNHLRKSKAKSKIVILMTDGVNTIMNAMPPQTAAQLARDNKIKVYTIGIGTNGHALFPTRYDIFGDIIFEEQEVYIDEPTLKEIAETTGGRYFRATSNHSLKSVYEEINKLEKTTVKSTKMYHYKEYFRWFLWVALVFLFLDALMRWWWFRGI